MVTEADLPFMERAVELAWQGRGWTSPNPMVGAVVVADGQIVGEGFHPQAGKPHAEIFALDAAGELSAGATLYITLEPCAHHGRTPPCVDRLIESGIKRVVVACEDPNPLVAGKGLQKLRDAGLEVEVGVLAREACQMNERFFKYIKTKRPFVAIKTGMSLDGKIATASGESQWITNEDSRGYVQILRATYDAIMVGVNTIVQDNPRLTCRLPGGRQPVRIVIDSMARTPINAQLFAQRGTGLLRPNVLICVSHRAPEDRVRALREVGAEILVCPDSGFSVDTHVDLEKLMPMLGKREITSVLLEGGGTLNAAALDSGIVDKVYVFIAPKIIGGVGAPTMVEGSGVTLLEEAVQLYHMNCTQMAGDLLVEAYTQEQR